MTLLSLLLATLLSTEPPSTASMRGAWQVTLSDGVTGTLIVTDANFSIAWYQKDPAKFIATEGGSWTRGEGDEVKATYEYDTAKPERVGTTEIHYARPSAKTLITGNTAGKEMAWTRLDDGAPGALQGAWLMTGRKRDGAISMRKPGARRTMKILSGTRFQWIAYNVETKEFFGSGGGTYTTKDGAYTETIEFFSRDDKKTGRSLEFRYGLPDGVWHHEGKSTAGEPMYEVWEKREKVGI